MDGNNPILHLDNLRKYYSGNAALCGVTLNVGQGSVWALMGPNGSGKTTLIKTAASLLHPTSGVVDICGVRGKAARSLVSYLPDRNIMPRQMTALDAAEYYKDYFADFDMDAARELLDFMHIRGDMRIGAMSKGMAERLNIALCFARQSRLYLLDEPLGGVDPVARERIVSSLRRIMRPASAVVVSTHIAHDLEGLFTHVCFIAHGKVVLAGEAEALKTQYGTSVEELYLRTFRGQE